jgi:hypothetical protein
MGANKSKAGPVTVPSDAEVGGPRAVRNESNPKVFFEVKAGGQALGRIEMELFADVVPKVCALLCGRCSSGFVEGVSEGIAEEAGMGCNLEECGDWFCPGGERKESQKRRGWVQFVRMWCWFGVQRVAHARSRTSAACEPFPIPKTAPVPRLLANPSPSPKPLFPHRRRPRTF